MLSKLVIGLHLIFLVLLQDGGMIRQVMRKHPDGSPYVVLYFKATTQELAKEEVYFPNGKLQWSGTYKNSIEDGVWKYYHENGRLKSEQQYSKGKENGVFSDYDTSGKMVKQSVYKNGKLEKELAVN